MQNLNEIFSDYSFNCFRLKFPINITQKLVTEHYDFNQLTSYMFSKKYFKTKNIFIQNDKNFNKFILCKTKNYLFNFFTKLIIRLLLVKITA